MKRYKIAFHFEFGFEFEFGHLGMLIRSKRAPLQQPAALDGPNRKTFQNIRISRKMTANTNDFNSLAYFHSNLNRRNQASKLLKVLARPGVWLLRPSKSDSVLALSQLTSLDDVSHARIFVHRRPRDSSVYGYSVESDPTVFPTVDELVARLRFAIQDSTPVVKQPPQPAQVSIQQLRASQMSMRGRQLPAIPQQQQTSPRAAVSQRASSPQMIDIQVADLEFGEQLGSGSFGTVYKGKLRGHAVAIKAPNASASAKEQAELEREARLMASIAPHPNVVRCFGLTAKPNMFVALQLCSNGSLFDLLQTDQPVVGAWMAKVLRETCAGMAHLAQHAIVHRDLAARNVLLDENWCAKIADFGMSRTSIGGAHQSTCDVAPLKWIAPESIKSRLYSEKTDVWSFAIVMVEVLTRDQPYPHLEPLQVAIKTAYEDLRPTPPAGCTDMVATVIGAATQTDPQRRPTFAQISNWLTNLATVWKNPQL